jgi:hypothetical protein
MAFICRPGWPLFVIPELDYPDVSADSVAMAAPPLVMAGRRPGHPENWKCLQCVSWMAGSSPAMTVETKFADVIMAFSASGNIRDRNKSKRLLFCGPARASLGRDDGGWRWPL